MFAGLIGPECAADGLLRNVPEIPKFYAGLVTFYLAKVEGARYFYGPDPCGDMVLAGVTYPTIKPERGQVALSAAVHF